MARDEACDQQPAGEFLCRRVGDDPLRDLDDAAVRDGDIDERLVLGPPALTQKEIEGHGGYPRR